MATVNEKMTAIANPIRSLMKETEPLSLDDMATDLTECVEANADLESVLYGTDFGGKSQNDMESIRTNVNQVCADFRDIKEHIAANGVEVVDGTPTSEYAGKVDEVYETGKAEINEAWWNTVVNTNRDDWNHVFRGMDLGYVGGFNPPFQIKPKSANCLFYKTKGIGVITADELDLSECTVITSAFERCDVTEIELIDSRSAPSLQYLLNENGSIQKVGRLILKDDGSQTISPGSFYSAYRLAEITFEGVIGSDIWFTHCSSLTRDSLLGKVATAEQIKTGKNLFTVNGNVYYGGIFGALKDFVAEGLGNTATITLHAMTKALLTDEEKAAATQKGWTIA